MKDSRKDVIGGEQNRTTRLSNRFGRVKIFSEKHFIELLVGVGTITIGSVESTEKTEASTSRETKRYIRKKMQLPYIS